MHKVLKEESKIDMLTEAIQIEKELEKKRLSIKRSILDVFRGKNRETGGKIQKTTRII